MHKIYFLYLKKKKFSIKNKVMNLLSLIALDVLSHSILAWFHIHAAPVGCAVEHVNKHQRAGITNYVW